jgi:hypothetical protein
MRMTESWRLLRRVAIAAAAAVPSVYAQTPGVPPRADSAFARARALVTEGNGVAGRTLVDSILQANKPGTPTFVEGLWWRAVLAEQAAPAEKDFLRLAIEHPASPRAPEALLRLGQLELARGARDAAAKHFDRLVTEHPDSPLVAQAWFGKGRALLDAGRVADGCSALSAARRYVTPAQVEFRTQLEFHAQRCYGAGASASPVLPPATPAVVPPAVTPPVVTPPAVAVPAEPKSAPVAAPAVSKGPLLRVAAGTFPTRAKATTQLRLVERAGFDGRVGLAGPGKFRVFVGEPMPRSEAQAVAATLTKKKVRGVALLAAEP